MKKSGACRIRTDDKQGLESCALDRSANAPTLRTLNTPLFNLLFLLLFLFLFPFLILIPFLILLLPSLLSPSLHFTLPPYFLTLTANHGSSTSHLQPPISDFRLPISNLRSFHTHRRFQHGFTKGLASHCRTPIKTTESGDTRAPDESSATTAATAVSSGDTRWLRATPGPTPRRRMVGATPSQPGRHRAPFEST